MPTKLKVRMLVSFCLMSLIPTLVGTYLVLMLQDRQGGGAVPLSLTNLSFIGLIVFLLSFFGYHIHMQIIGPIEDIKRAAKSMAEGHMEVIEDTTVPTTDEMKELQKSLLLIARNAKDLAEKANRLSSRDKLTGLYSSTYIRERLSEEIGRAIHYQRPCAFAYLTVASMDEYLRDHKGATADDVSKKIADILNRNMGQFDRAAGVGRGEFMMIFPDKNKKKTMEIVEKIHAEVSGEMKNIVLCAGISENPIDGVEADSLFIKAQDRLKIARTTNKLLEAFA